MEISKHTIQLFKNILKVLEPPPEITLSSWADKYRVLSAGTSSESGRWQTSRTPYLKGIMDAVTDPKVRVVAVMSSAQVGKSELILNTVGCYAHVNPTSIMLVQPTINNARSFSKERLAPMIRDTDVLAKVFNSKDSSNNILNKVFEGGYVALEGANSPAGLASRPIEVLVCDEIDRYPDSAGKEGDPLSIVSVRTKTYPYTYKHVFVSTPTIDEVSRIQHEFKRGTQSEYQLPCPACGKYQKMEWAKIHFILEDGRLTEDDVLQNCDFCGEYNNEKAWKKGKGKWKENFPNEEIKTFHLSSLVSPWQSWRNIVQNFLSAKNDAEMLKVWTNTELGEVWTVDGERINFNDLIDRRFLYEKDIPDEVVLLTCGVDVQDDRFELEVLGFDVNNRLYGIEYKVLYGDTSLKSSFDNLDEHLSKIYDCGDNKQMKISSVCIDSGGHRTDLVYKFCKEREHRKVFAIKGRGGTGLHSIDGFRTTKKVKNTLFFLGVNTIKDDLHSKLLRTDENIEGYCFFPLETEKGYNEKYFQGLTSEIRVTSYVKGRVKFEWKLKQGVRNEPLDCRVYAMASFEILRPDLKYHEKVKNGTIKKKSKKPKVKNLEV